MADEQSWEFYVAGVKFHEAHKVISLLEKEMAFDLVPEPTNKYDSNAVKLVWDLEDDTYMIGYVPKKISAEVAAFLEYAEEPICEIIEVTPSNKPWEQIKVVIREA